MARPIPMPPPGFDELSADEKVSYVQSLWDRVTADPSEIRVPEWHRTELTRRLREREGQQNGARDWEEVRRELRNGLNPIPEE